MGTRRTRHSPRLLLVAVVSLFASCISATEPVTVVTWEATLIPTGATVDLSGTVAMVIGERETQMGLGIHDASPDGTLGWAVREGTCADPGERVGPAEAYPAVAISALGTGTAETVLFRRIATAGPYSGVVFGNEDGSGPVLACGDLEPRN